MWRYILALACIGGIIVVAVITQRRARLGYVIPRRVYTLYFLVVIGSLLVAFGSVLPTNLVAILSLAETLGAIYLLWQLHEEII